MNHPDWLNDTEWDPSKENIILVHGYAGGDDTLPIVVLRDGTATAKRTSSMPEVLI